MILVLMKLGHPEGGWEWGQRKIQKEEAPVTCGRAKATDHQAVQGDVGEIFGCRVVNPHNAQ